MLNTVIKQEEKSPPLNWRQHIITALWLAENYMTCSEIVRSLRITMQRPDLQTEDISGLLTKMTKTGEISRIDNYGPRGGYGYMVQR